MDITPENSLSISFYLEGDINLGQLGLELRDALGEDVGVSMLTGVEDQNPKINCTLMITPVNVDPMVVEAVIEAHVPVRHYEFSDDLVKLHDAWISLLTGELDHDQLLVAVRAVALRQTGDLPECDCSEPLAR